MALSALPAAPASRTLVPLYLSHGVLHMLIGIYPAVLLVLRGQFETDFATLGAVFTAATFLYGIGSIPTGFILNRVHPLTIVRGYLTLAAAAAGLVAAAPSETTMAVGLLLLGLAGSPYHTAGMTLISRVSGNAPKLMAHHGMAGNIGLAVAPAFGALLAAAVSWRLPFAAAAGMTVLVLLSTLAMPRLPNPTDGTTHPRSHLVHGATHLGALVLVYAITMALGFVFRGFAFFLPALATQRAAVFPGDDIVRGGILAALVYLVGFFGQWSAVRLGDRPGLERTYTLLLAGQVVLLSAVVPLTGWGLIAVLMVFSVVHFATQPLDNVLTGKYTSLTRRGVGYGFSFGLSFGVGSFAAWASGAVADAAGDRFQYAYLMLAGVALIATWCGTALWFLHRRLSARTPETRRPPRGRPFPDAPEL